MSPLNIHPEEDRTAKKKKDNKVLKVLLGISALIAVPVIGTTLAASISINSGTAVQFGQGIATAAACDSSILVTPNASFIEADDAFKLGTVTISNLDATECASKTLRFRFYPTTAGTDSALTVSSGGTTDAIIFTMPASSGTQADKEAGTNYTVGTHTAGSTTASITVTLVTQPATTSIARITVESY
jgi:predicted RecA/RadA family phage recombinase